jgi:hypothetical protein
LGYVGWAQGTPEQIGKPDHAKEKHKALDAKSAGTQHRHPRGKSHHI